MTQDLSRYLGFLIRRAQQAHAAVWQREVGGGLTSVQFGVLSALDDHPGASQRDLGVALDVDRSTVADLMKRLERQGLIHRVRADDDRRRNILELTDSGRRALAAAQPGARSVDEVLNSGLSAAESRELRRLLALVLDNPKVRDALSAGLETNS